MLITFIFSYLESFFVVFHLSFYFILVLAISAREHGLNLTFQMKNVRYPNSN